MFDRLVFLSGAMTPDDMRGLLLFLEDNPGVVVALRKRKITMLVNAETITVRKDPAVEAFVNSTELRNYLVKTSETQRATVYRFRNREVKELHDLAILVYTLSELQQPVATPTPQEPKPNGNKPKQKENKENKVQASPTAKSKKTK